jgi:hypothetical protein
MFAIEIEILYRFTARPYRLDGACRIKTFCEFFHASAMMSPTAKVPFRLFYPRAHGHRQKEFSSGPGRGST